MRLVSTGVGERRSLVPLLRELELEERDGLGVAASAMTSTGPKESPLSVWGGAVGGTRLTDFPEDDLLADDLLLDLLEEDFDDEVPERAWDEELER